MNRREFTKAISTLILEMIKDGNHPIYDFCLRSAEEQKRLFDKGLSKCDGKNNLSQHQKGLAMDIYFVVESPAGLAQVDYGYEKTAELAKKYHEVWVLMGGEPIIDWDKPHYESK